MGGRYVYIRRSHIVDEFFVHLNMKYDLKSLIGFLFLFVLAVLVNKSFNEHSEYRFEVLHFLLFFVGVGLARARIIEIIQLVKDTFNKGDKTNFNDEEE